MSISTTIPAIAIEKLIPILESQLMKLFDISSYIEIAVNSLPIKVKCNDPRVQDIKQQLENVKQLLLNIDKIKKAMAKLTSSFKIVATVAQGVELIQLAIPAVPGVPQGPFAKLAILASSLGKNCKSASECLSSLLSSIDLATSKLESIIAIAITKLTTICTNERFVVNSSVQSEIYKLTEQSKSTSKSDGSGKNNGNFAGGYVSKFYNEYNVSDDDLETLNSIIYELNELELNVSDYLVEAPTAVYKGNSLPDPSLGKIGDFYINLSANTLYGPKPFDDLWNDTPITYFDSDVKSY